MNQTIETDVLVIGTGAVGATYARLALDAGKRVLMIDSGPQLRRIPGEHLLNTFRNQLEPNLSLDTMYANREVYSIPGSSSDFTAASLAPLYKPPVGRLNFQNPEQNPNRNMPNAAAMYAVGGMFSLWSGYAPDPTPMERTPLLSAAEWDQSLAIARVLYQANTTAFEPSIGNRALKAVLSGTDYSIESAQMGAQKRGAQGPLGWFVTWTGTDTILGPFVRPDGSLHPNLAVLGEHRAERLELSGTNVDRVAVRNLRTWEMTVVRSDKVVVAGGSFLTPRLLWQSGIRPEALGRYLHENPVASVHCGVNEAVVEALRSDPRNPDRGELVPIPRNDPPPKSSLSPTAEKPWMAHINREGRTLVYNLPVDVRLTLDITFYGMIEPRADNRITFSETLQDRFGQPQITIDYHPSEADGMRQLEMLGDLERLAAMLGTPIPGSQATPDQVGPRLAPYGTALHLMGTYRMGDDQRTSVVDANCKVWGVDNLYLGGQGVIGGKMASNPTLAASAIAVKSAASMLGRSLARMALDIETGGTNE